MVSPGGASRHPRAGPPRARRRARGAEFVLREPAARRPARVRRAPSGSPIVPGTDVAVMLGARPHARRRATATTARSSRATASGFDRFERYLRGAEDGLPEDARVGRAALRDSGGDDPRAGAADGREADAHQRELVAPARRARRAGALDGRDAGGDARPDRAARRRLRQRLRLARLRRPRAAPASARRPCPRARTRCAPFIPFARVADMLLHPGEPFDFDGQRLAYPRHPPRLLVRRQPVPPPSGPGAPAPRARHARTRIVVHDPFWTPMARHADVVLPATMTLERNDIGGSPNDACLIAMRQAVEPYGAGSERVRDLQPISRRRSVSASASPRDGTRWRGSATSTRAGARRSPTAAGRVPPDFDEFWAAGSLEVPDADHDLVILKAFRADPEGARLCDAERADRDLLGRPSTASATRTAPATRPGSSPTEWLGAPLARRFPLHLVANNPTTRLHSQLDVGRVQPGSKVQGREPIRMHPADAAHRGIRSGDVVRVFNDRGQLPGRRRRHRRRAAPRRAALDGRLVRPARPGGSRRDVRPRESERAHLRPGHLEARAGLLGPARPRRGRAVDRSPAADPRLRSAADGAPSGTVAGAAAASGAPRRLRPGRA